MELVFGTILTVILLNSLHVLRAKHERRFAQAKLEIVRAVTEIEKMMLERELCDGDICHDTMHDRMLVSQYGIHYKVDWKSVFLCSKPAAEWIELRKRLGEEIEKDTQLGKLMLRYVKAEFKAFRNQRPFASMLFWFWASVQNRGLLFALLALIAILRAMMAARNFITACQQEWNRLKVNAAEWYATGQMLNRQV